MAQRASWTHQSYDLQDLEVAEYTRPFHLVGGDLLEVRALGHGRWDILVLDVAGKGMPAYRVARKLRQVFQSLPAGRPGEILESLNHAMHELAEDLTCFATALLVHLDLPAGRARIADAGHTPLLRRRGNGITERIKLQLHQPGRPTDLPLGVDLRTAYPERSLKVSPGDTFVLFTDGLSEARDQGGKMLGTEGLMDTLSELGGNDPEALLQGLLQRAEENTCDGLQDDATCAVVRIPQMASDGVSIRGLATCLDLAA